MSRVAAIVPTKDRPEWVKRQKYHYSTSNLFINLRLAEGPGLMESVYRTALQSTEPYLVFSGDDDFHLDEGVWCCVDQLRMYPERRVSAQGYGLLVGVHGHVIESASWWPLNPLWAVYPRDVFIECAAAARHGQTMNHQEELFVNRAERLVVPLTVDWLQLIRCHHSGRARQEHFPRSVQLLKHCPPLWKTAQWCASWLPFREYSYYSLMRKSHPYHYPFKRFVAMMESL